MKNFLLPLRGRLFIACSCGETWTRGSVGAACDLKIFMRHGGFDIAPPSTISHGNSYRGFNDDIQITGGSYGAKRYAFIIGAFYKQDVPMGRVAVML